MTFAAHAALGGMVYATAAHLVGAPPEISGGAFVLGAGLGVTADALPWAVRMLTQRGDLEGLLRELLHEPAGSVRTWSAVLVAPWLHVVADRFIHAPRLPDPGSSPAHDRVLLASGAWRFTVRDLVWCAGEASLWVIVALLILLYRIL